MNIKHFLDSIPSSCSFRSHAAAANEVDSHVQALLKTFEVSSAEIRRRGEDIHGRTLVEKALTEADEFVLHFRRSPRSLNLTPSQSPTRVEERAPSPEEALADDESIIVNEYKAAAEGRSFVAIKWFRDTWIPSTSIPWGKDPDRIHRALAAALEKGLLRKEQIPNPRNADHPTTVLKEGVVVGAPDGRRLRDFAPIAIKGKPLSETVLEGR